MRITALVAVAALVTVVGCEPQKTAEAKTMEVGCAMHVYKMAGAETCAAAVKVDDKTLLMEGEAADAGKLMAAGFCKAAVKADVVGKVEGDKFIATSVTVMPDAAAGAAKDAAEGSAPKKEG